MTNKDPAKKYAKRPVAAKRLKGLAKTLQKAGRYAFARELLHMAASLSLGHETIYEANEAANKVF